MLGPFEVVWDSLLDRSIVFSYDRTGFRRHAARFPSSDLDVDLGGKTVLVTGGNSGIGKGVARGLVSRGASVVLLGRDAQRAGAAVWLAASPAAAGSSGLFWFDREPQPTHLLALTREAPAEREELWRTMHRLAGVPLGTRSRVRRLRRS